MKAICWIWVTLLIGAGYLCCVRWRATEPIVPVLTEKLDELKRIKELQDDRQAQQLQEAEEKFESMKEMLLTENALLR